MINVGEMGRLAIGHGELHLVGHVARSDNDNHHLVVRNVETLLHLEELVAHESAGKRDRTEP